VIAVAAVLPIALLQAWLSVSLHANQIVSGIGINILVLGGTTFAYRELLGNRSRVQIPGLGTGSCRALGHPGRRARRCSSRARCSTLAFAARRSR
jgi:simple sugar transport system permease protein